MRVLGLVLFLSVVASAAVDTLVPPKPGQATRKYYTAFVSTSLDSGDTVLFHDGVNPATIDFVSCSTDAVIEFLASPVGTDAQKVKQKFVAGGWHRQRMHKIYSSVPDTAGIVVKTE